MSSTTSVGRLEGVKAPACSKNDDFHPLYPSSHTQPMSVQPATRPSYFMLLHDIELLVVPSAATRTSIGVFCFNFVSSVRSAFWHWLLRPRSFEDESGVGGGRLKLSGKMTAVRAGVCGFEVRVYIHEQRGGGGGTRSWAYRNPGPRCA
ncbi:hypothetical protein GALMADRAFT_147712 [Galerina marginata CBS 339.88]|uniref:Uncharacterized protein n=1 Tax=Galerina marginata (strain CBS 339.88) TaxID=685588 RepID=A0A067S778_GALM3|nr:hypothetical protein GALMADRAFT_147712 [Galerina marginata CBS 339.88]